jgi:hypothetical protein
MSIQSNMENTMIIQLTNQKAVVLLNELEELQMIKILKRNVEPSKTKLSEKYRGMISKVDGQILNNHIEQMRSEWNNF